MCALARLQASPARRHPEVEADLGAARLAVRRVANGADAPRGTLVERQIALAPHATSLGGLTRLTRMYFGSR